MAKKTLPNTVIIREYRGVPGQLQPLANRMIEYLKNTPADKLINVVYSSGGDVMQLYLDLAGFKPPMTAQQKDRYTKAKSIEANTPIISDARQQLDELVRKYDTLTKEHERLVEEACTIQETNDILEKENQALHEGKADLERRLEAKSHITAREPLQDPYEVKGALQECIAVCEKEKEKIVGEGFELASVQLSQRVPYSGEELQKAIDTLQARDETLSLQGGGVFESYPEEAKIALQEAWDCAEQVKQEHDAYFSDKNRIPLLAQLKYDNGGVTVSLSVKADADDQMSEELKKRFEAYAHKLTADAEKKTNAMMDEDSTYLKLHYDDRATVDWMSHKLRVEFRDMMGSSNLELIVLKDNGRQVTESQQKMYQNDTIEGYDSLGTLRELCEQRASEAGYRSLNSFLDSQQGLKSIYQHLIREDALKQEDERAKLKWRGKTLSKYATLLGVSMDVLDKFVDVK